MSDPLHCKCGNTADYWKECRDCYEDRMRHEQRDDYYRDTSVITRRMLAKERCQMRLYMRRREGDE